MNLCYNTVMRKNDVILIVALLLIAIISFIFTRVVISNKGDYVVAKENGKEILRVDLSKDGEYKIFSSNGYNELLVKDGKVMVTDSNCKNKICVQHRPIDKTTESIICLPHKLIIEIEKSADDSEVDSESK